VLCQPAAPAEIGDVGQWSGSSDHYHLEDAVDLKSGAVEKDRGPRADAVAPCPRRKEGRSKRCLPLESRLNDRPTQRRLAWPAGKRGPFEALFARRRRAPEWGQGSEGRFLERDLYPSRQSPLGQPRRRKANASRHSGGPLWARLSALPCA